MIKKTTDTTTGIFNFITLFMKIKFKVLIKAHSEFTQKAGKFIDTTIIRKNSSHSDNI